MRTVKLTVALFWLCAAGFAADRSAPNAAFDRYVALAEADLTRRDSGGILLIDEAADRESVCRRLTHGEVIVQRLRTDDHGARIPVPGGLIHHWVATEFVPGATLDQVLRLVQDYDHEQQFYAPDVQRSRLISRRGDDFHIFLRFQRTRVITVVLDTEHDVHYTRQDATHASSRSVSTRIAEVVNPGAAGEHELAPADDHGFLWRLNSYWRFEQQNGGVFIECEAISLTRDIPAGLGWLVGPFVESVPRESLLFTMTATRRALENNRFPNSSSTGGPNGCK